MPDCIRYLSKALALLEQDWGQGEADSLLESWPWWLLVHLAPDHRARVVDCYLLEGHKVLFRAALALLKTFYKQVKLGRKQEEQTAQKEQKEQEEQQKQETMSRYVTRQASDCKLPKREGWKLSSWHSVAPPGSSRENSWPGPSSSQGE